MNGYDSLEDVWRWECPVCPREYGSWNAKVLEAFVEYHEWLQHGIPYADE